MTKPTREFDGVVGAPSTGAGGPAYLKLDLDKLFTMMDPSATHTDGSSGGIGTENIQPNAVTTNKIAAGAATDAIIGNRTVDENISTIFSNTGTLTQLLSWIAKVLKGIIGASWTTTPATTLLAAKAHADAAAPHGGHETPTGAQSKVDSHNSLNTGVHGVAGVLVGTTDTQTLTNKTLGATTMAGALALGNHKITGLGTPTNTTDGVTKGYADTRDALITANLDAHKTSNDHDGRYYTETEIQTLISVLNGAIATLNSIASAGGNITIAGGKGITIANNAGAKTITITATGEAFPAAHASAHAEGGIDHVSPESIGAATANHNHDLDYAAILHNHDLDYAAITHNHDLDYEPIGAEAAANAYTDGVTGDLTTLDTTEKTNLVGAINETLSVALAGATITQEGTGTQYQWEITAEGRVQLTEVV